MDLLLDSTAGSWAETNGDAAYLLSIEQPTQETVGTFKALFEAEFPAETFESEERGLPWQVRRLHQGSEELLPTYYRTVRVLMQRLGARDRQTSAVSPQLSLLESSMLDIIILAFVTGLNDQDVKLKAVAGLVGVDRSLQNTYFLAENALKHKALLVECLEPKAQIAEWSDNTDMNSCQVSSTSWSREELPLSTQLVAAASSRAPGNHPYWS